MMMAEKAASSVANPEGKEVEPKSDASTIETDEGQKHFLQSPWKFWYFENSKDRSWEDNLRVVSPFQTVEDFWSVYNHIKSATEIRIGGSYFVFKDGIKPMWEDAANRLGGRWVVTFNKNSRQHLDNYWLEVLLCLIGEAFDDDGDDICGAVVDIRSKQDRISIWTADWKNKERVLAIGKKVQARLSLQGVNQLTYEAHEATAVKAGSYAKTLYQL